MAADFWQIQGSPNELWTITDSEVTGFSQLHFTQSFLVTDPAKQPALTDFYFAFRLTPLQGVDHNFVWNFQDPNNYYQVHFNGGALWLSRFRFGQEALSVARNFSMSVGHNYAIELTQLGSQIRLLINGVEVVNFADGTNNVDSSGAVGFKLSPGAVVPVETYFSEIALTDLSVKQLPVPLFKQTDAAWQTLTYDTANLWSANPTIGRWGCVLASVAMILQYHQLVIMPDGRPATPATINSWLINQPDGYVGQGLVNWFAIQRLAREISDSFASRGQDRPKLEFAYQGPSNWQAVAKAAIATNQPPIAQVPGHFTVISGVDTHADDFFINDPLYDYERLSQHQPVQSLRLFRPSHTDLSAIVLVHRPSVSVAILNELGDNITQTWQEEITDLIDGESTGVWQFTVVSKPLDGQYTINVAGAQEEGDVIVFTYDQLANVQTYQLLKSQYINFDIFTFSIDFTKATGGEFQLPYIFSWHTFLQQLSKLRDNQLISQPIYARLNSLANLAAAADEATWQRYKYYLTNLIEFYQAEIDSEVRNSLLALLQ